MSNKSYEQSGLNLLLSVEIQLKAYSEEHPKSERHIHLWETWRQNKYLIRELLKLVFPSTPFLSGHDQYHIETVMHNIERILGEERIHMLSASDCFVLLHAVYLHDISLYITKKIKEKIVKEDDFKTLVDNMSQSIYADEGLYAEYVNMEDHKVRNNNDNVEYKELYSAKLKIADAMAYLIQNYQRKGHAGKSAKWIREQLESDGALAKILPFDKSGIPTRIFKVIEKCAQLHSVKNYGDVMKQLSHIDDGYILDYIHPRFIATLVHLGDVLDLDSDRFHPFIREYIGKPPERFELHYGKHSASKKLLITSDKIELEADCNDNSVLRLVKEEYDEIRELLKDANYHWLEIAPKDMPGRFPIFEDPILYVNGTKANVNLAKLRFDIKRERAFGILEGANIYENRFVFLRELVQNSLDATKIHYWKHNKNYIVEKIKKDKFKSDDKDKYRLDDKEKFKLFETIQKNGVEDYKITVTLEVAKCIKDREEIEKDNILLRELKEYEDKEDDKDSTYYMPIKDEENPNTKAYEYGVHVSVQDRGTGITEENLKDLADAARRKDIDEAVKDAPFELQPTATFGLGLQSVFLVNNRFICKTHTRNNEHFFIEFKSGKIEEGYINAAPLKYNDKMPHGTCMDVFVPNDMIHDALDLHDENTYLDSFNKDSESYRPVHTAKNLIFQLKDYLIESLGTQLFPIEIIMRIPEKKDPKKYPDSKKLYKIKTEIILIGLTCIQRQIKNYNEIAQLYQFLQRQNINNIDTLDESDEKKCPERVKCKDKICSTVITQNIAEKYLKLFYNSKDDETHIIKIARLSKEEFKEFNFYNYNECQKYLCENIIKEKFNIKIENYKDDEDDVNKIEEIKPILKHYLPNEIFKDLYLKSLAPGILEDDNNSRYWMDLRKNVLCVWNAKHSTYAQFGIKRILYENQEWRETSPSVKHYGIKDDEKLKTQILYKAIHVAYEDLEQDASLLERMDIHEKFGIEYLNMNRNGFTKKGEKYVKYDIYPSVLKTAQMALIDWMKIKITDDNYKNQYVYIQNKFFDIVKDYDSKKQREAKWSILHAESLLTEIMFLIFAMINCNDQHKEEHKDICYIYKNNVYGKINEHLKTIFEDNNFNFMRSAFAIKLFLLPCANIDTIKINFISLFNLPLLSENLAIASYRSGRHAIFHSILVYKEKIIEEDEEIKKYPPNNMEEYANNFFRALGDYHSEQPSSGFFPLYSKESNHNTIIHWIMQNIPHSAVFSNDYDEGNFRLNFLSLQKIKTIYFDRNIKMMLVDRMIRGKYGNNHKAERFYGVVWKGYEALTVSEIPEDVKYLSRGYIPKLYKEQMLIPISTPEAENLFPHIAELFEIKYIFDELSDDFIKVNTNDIDEDVYENVDIPQPIPPKENKNKYEHIIKKIDQLIHNVPSISVNDNVDFKKIREEIIVEFRRLLEHSNEARNLIFSWSEENEETNKSHLINMLDYVKRVSNFKEVKIDKLKEQIMNYKFENDPEIKIYLDPIPPIIKEFIKICGDIQYSLFIHSEEIIKLLAKYRKYEKNIYEKAQTWKWDTKKGKYRLGEEDEKLIKYIYEHQCSDKYTEDEIRTAWEKFIKEITGVNHKIDETEKSKKEHSSNICKQICEDIYNSINHIMEYELKKEKETE